MRVRVIPAVAAAVCLASGGVAAAQEPAEFPASLEREPLLTWLQRETDIQPDRVVAVTPQALTSVVSSFPAEPGTGPRIVIRAEALSAETLAHTEALSWQVSMNADCESHRVRLGETTGYRDRNLLGDRKLLRPAETDWRTPEVGTALEAAWRAACQADFKGPFDATAARTAQAPAAPAKPTRPAQAASGSGSGPVVQVGASPSETEIKSLLAALEPSLTGRKAWIETAQVGGKTWRRAVVGGFADGADASRFCAELKAAGRSCFVRASRPG